MKLTFLWKWMGGDEHIAVRMNEISNGKTVDEIESQFLVGLEKLEHKLNENQFAKINDVLNSFANRFNEEEKVRQELYNKISDIEKYIKLTSQANQIDEMAVLDIVKKQIQKIDIPDAKVDENSISEKVMAKILPAIRIEISNYSEKIREADNKITELQNMHIQDQKNLSMLNYALEKEKKRNDELETIIKKGEQERAELFSMIREIKDSISGLKAKKESFPVSDTLKENNKVEVIEGERKTEEKQEDIHILYSSEKQNYDLVLNRFIENAKELERKAQMIYRDSEDGEIIIKLINKCSQKFIKLKEKNNENDYDVEKIVSETAKIIKQTIAKALSQSDIRDYVDDYLKKCGIRKINWQVGKKLNENDYEYLGETVLYDQVENKSDDETITEIVQNSYVIDYEEDNEKYEKLISGIYHIGRYGK